MSGTQLGIHRGRDQQCPGWCGGRALLHPGEQTLVHQALDEHGSGSVLAIALIGVILGCAGLLLTLVWALGVKHTVQATAESAALAAADVASGAIPGYPCDRASEAAALGGATLDSCEVGGPVASVRVSRSVLGMDVVVNAKAGPEETSGPAGAPP